MHFQFTGNSRPTRRFLVCLIILAVGFLSASPATAQDVWLDFTSDFHDGDNGAANGVPDWIDELNEATRRAAAAPLP